MPLWFIVALQKTFLLQSLLMVCGEAVRQSIITLNVYSNVSWWLLLNYISGNVKYLIKQVTFNSISWLAKYFSLVNWLKWLFWHLLTPLSSNVSFLNDVRSSKVTSMLSCIFGFFGFRLMCCYVSLCLQRIQCKKLAILSRCLAITFALMHSMLPWDSFEHSSVGPIMQYCTASELIVGKTIDIKERTDDMTLYVVNFELINHVMRVIFQCLAAAMSIQLLFYCDEWKTCS